MVLAEGRRTRAQRSVADPLLAPRQAEWVQRSARLPQAGPVSAQERHRRDTPVLGQQAQLGRHPVVSRLEGRQAACPRDQLPVAAGKSPAEKPPPGHPVAKSPRPGNLRPRAKPANPARRRESQGELGAGKAEQKRLAPVNQAAGKRRPRGVARLPGRRRGRAQEGGVAARVPGVARGGKFPHPVRSARGAVTLK